MKQPVAFLNDFAEQPDKIVAVRVVPDDGALLVTPTGNVPESTRNLEAKLASQTWDRSSEGPASVRMLIVARWTKLGKKLTLKM